MNNKPNKIKECLYLLVSFLSVAINITHATDTQKYMLYYDKHSFFRDMKNNIQKMETAVSEGGDISPYLNYGQAIYILVLKPELLKEENLDLFFADPDKDFSVYSDLREILQNGEKLENKLDEIIYCIYSTNRGPLIIDLILTMYEKEIIPKDKIEFWNYIFVPKIIKSSLNNPKCFFNESEKIEKLTALAEYILCDNTTQKKLEYKLRSGLSKNKDPEKNKNPFEELHDEVLNKITSFGQDDVLDKITNILSNQEANDRLGVISPENLKLWKDAVEKARIKYFC